MTDQPKSGPSTQIVVALIGVAGVIAAALFGNWDKIFGGPITSTSTSGAVAAGGTAAIAPTDAAAVKELGAAQTRAFEAGASALDDVAAQIEAGSTPSVSGTWQDTDGHTYLITQNGAAYSYTQMRLGQQVGTGQGSIHGNIVSYRYTGYRGSGACIGEIAPDYQSSAGRCTDDATGASWPFRVTR